MVNQAIEARTLSTDEFTHLAVPLRQAVFVKEQHIDPAIEWDGKDEACTHYGAWLNDRFVATARVSPSGKLGRMAVDKSVRRRGIGRVLVTAIVQAETAKHTPEIFLHAQADAIPFYHSLGFVAQGPRFLEAGIEHQLMRLSLPGGEHDNR